MKKILFAAMAATVLFASCSKDNDPDNGDAGEQAKLVINVQSPSLDTRAVSDNAPQTGDDATITNYIVFVFNGQILQARKDATGTGPVTITSGVTTSANSVYVVANNGTLAIPETVNTKARLEAWIGDLSSSASQITASKRWATGVNNSLSFNSNNEAMASVTLKFIAARITVKVQTMSNYTNSPTNGKSLVIKGVTILNAGGATKLFSSPMMPTANEMSTAGFTGKSYYAGMNMLGMMYAPPTASYSILPSVLSDDVAGLSKSVLESKYFYFYSFENNATSADKFPTIVTLVAQYDDKPVYYPVHLAKYQTFNSGSVTEKGVERGNSYDITIRLTGDAEYPGGDPGGEDDPTIPNIDGKLTVDLCISNWTPVVLEKEF